MLTHPAPSPGPGRKTGPDRKAGPGRRDAADHKASQRPSVRQGHTAAMASRGRSVIPAPKTRPGSNNGGRDRLV